jgi:lipopolysaccharide/colanic/teichoic acid biosynthesis glycosyltransferase
MADFVARLSPCRAGADEASGGPGDCWRPGPIFERQTCIALGGRRFQILNFRTTVPDPERSMPEWAREPTQLGGLLRYTRIESLPQLINVLRGDISLWDLVGSSPSFLD